MTMGKLLRLKIQSSKKEKSKSEYHYFGYRFLSFQAAGMELILGAQTAEMQLKLLQ